MARVPSAADAYELYREGRLADAVSSLGDALRDDPTDVKGRTFLFELLCFSGAYDRAHKQLDAIASADAEIGLGTAWYHEALHAEEQRQEMFRSGDLPEGTASPVSGVLNGTPFEDLRDADPRIGPRLEAIVGGRYLWLPLQHVARLTAEPPARLRDLFWMPASFDGAPGVGEYAGEVLLPAMSPLSWQHPDEAVRLGRMNDWWELESGEEIPVGTKLLLVDGKEYPLLEVRELIISSPEA